MDQERQAKERLEQLLLEGMKSGPASPMTREHWAELRAEVAKRLHTRRGGRTKNSL